MEGVSFELTIQGSTRLESRDPRRFGVEIATFPGPGTAIWSGNSNVSGPPGPGFRGENHGKPNGFSMVFWPETLLFPLQMASKIEKKHQKPIVFQSFFGRKRYYFHSKWPSTTKKNHEKPNGFSMIFRPETLLFPLQTASRPRRGPRGQIAKKYEN